MQTAVADRFPHPQNWWTCENGQKAYEMMSCYDGLLEWYRITRQPHHLQAVINTVRSILDDELLLTGSGSSFECWYHGQERQTEPTMHMQETCVTQTLITTRPGCWFSCTASCTLGDFQEIEFGRPRNLTLVDYASAGNTWSRESRFRVWWPLALNPIEP